MVEYFILDSDKTFKTIKAARKYGQNHLTHKGKNGTTYTKIGVIKDGSRPYFIGEIQFIPGWQRNVLKWIKYEKDLTKNTLVYELKKDGSLGKVIEKW